MSTYSPIFTNNALAKMKNLGLSEGAVLDAFNSGQTEASKFGGWLAVKKYPGYEIGVHYNKNQQGAWIIISVWKRDNRR